MFGGLNVNLIEYISVVSTSLPFSASSAFSPTSATENPFCRSDLLSLWALLDKFWRLLVTFLSAEDRRMTLGFAGHSGTVWTMPSAKSEPVSMAGTGCLFHFGTFFDG